MTIKNSDLSTILTTLILSPTKSAPENQLISMITLEHATDKRDINQDKKDLYDILTATGRGIKANYNEKGVMTYYMTTDLGFSGVQSRLELLKDYANKISDIDMKNAKAYLKVQAARNKEPILVD